MEFKFDKTKLQQAIDDFYYATGVGILIMKSDFTNLNIFRTADKPYCDTIRCFKSIKSKCITFDRTLMQRCKESRRIETAVCHGGLVNVAIPIISQNVIVAYVMLYGFKQGDYAQISEEIMALPLDLAQLTADYQKIPIFDERKIQSVTSIAIMVTNYIISNGIITLNLCSDLERAKEYIDQHLDQSLSIQEISRHTNISKSSLYKVFHQTLNCTVNEYIISQRLQKAEILLLTTDATLDEIAAAIGFSSADYLGHLFKEKTGQTPMQFRKSYR